MVIKQKIGQLKIQQMSFMLVAVFIFFVLAGLFVLSLSLSGIRRSAAELEEKDAILLVEKLANSPEFSCEQSFGNKVNCIDKDKAIVLKDSINKYSDFWGVSNIVIRTKLTEKGIECNSGNYPDCDYINIISKETNGFSVDTFVTICRKDSDENKIYDNCEIGKLIVYYDE